MEKGWVKIYTTDEIYKAELIKNLLDNEDIENVLLNKKDSLYVMLGELEIYVKQDFAVIALNIIGKHETE